MRRIIVGTAGHIDHGKTTLLKTLTGIDCDRWAEEKRRGITIDLGFAHLLEGDLQIGFVDVPGHERFVHNALAGLGGIRLVLLVVAADEGVKPQTEEHLAICTLLSIPGCVVALTKSDLVDEDVLELAALEIEELLAPTSLAGSPVVAVSSTTGDGIGDLRRLLIERAGNFAAEPDLSRPVRFPIDRAFHLKGLGVVTTGTLVSGSVKVGDSLVGLPSQDRVRVRNLQVHGEERTEAVAGERTAMQLTGVDLSRLYRGLQLVEENQFGISNLLVGNYSHLADVSKPIKGWTSVRFHLYSSDIGGKIRPLQGAIEPGQQGLVEIRLAHPVTAVRGDQFVVRRPSPPMTLGGGEILDPEWHRRRPNELDNALKSLSGEMPDLLLLWVKQAQERGVETSELARRLGINPHIVEKQLTKLVASQALLRMDEGRGHGLRWIAPGAYQRISDNARTILANYFRKQRLSQGMPKAEAIERIVPTNARDLADTYLNWLEAQKILEVKGDRVDQSGRSTDMSGDESRLSVEILERFSSAGLTPPSPKQICLSLEAKPQIFDGLIRYLTQRGDLVRLPGGLIIAAVPLRELGSDLQDGELDQFNVGQFKDRYGLTRKWAIPILEHLDSAGVTRRIGDLRQVVRSNR